MRLIAVAAAVVALAALAGTAHAHQSSVKYIDITVDGARAGVRFTVAPSDVTAPLGLPETARPTVAEAAVPAAAAHVAGWLALALPGGATCPASPAAAAPDPDGRFVVVTWDAVCPDTIGRLRLDLAAFFAVDTRHEAIVTVHPPGETVDPHVVRAGALAVELYAGQAPSLGSWIAYGIHHIFGGPDHVSFVIALLLVVVIARRGAGWERRRPLAALRTTAGIVTAFTIAHSLTLIAASLGWIRLPGRPVESLIAASILYTAIENVVRPDVRHRFAMTFGFGLVHGLGFASVLEDALPPTHVLAPLLGFNLGVELGQLAIVAVALPLCGGLAYAMGAERYRRIALPVLAVPLVLVAMKWLIERVFDIQTFSLFGM